MTGEMKCPEDGRPMVKRGGRFGTFLACERWPICDVTHSLHPNGLPMGTPAKRDVRVARTEAHQKFDAMWNRLGWTRNGAYKWLERVMGLTQKEAHIASLNFNQCHALMAVIRDAEGEAGVFAGQVDEKSGHVFSEQEVIAPYEAPLTEERVIRDWGRNYRKKSGKEIEAQFKRYKGNQTRRLQRERFKRGGYDD